MTVVGSNQHMYPALQSWTTARRKRLVRPGNRRAMRAWWEMLYLVMMAEHEEVIAVPLGVTALTRGGMVFFYYRGIIS